MSTVTDILLIDGHTFDAEERVWSDTTVWKHDDCGGADITLVEVDGNWAWWAKVSPEHTVRIGVDDDRLTTPSAAFEAARRAVAQWQALNAW